MREQLTFLRKGYNVGLASILGRIAFVREDDIWIKDLETGEERRLTEDGRSVWPQWSADGRWIAFRKTSPPDSYGGYQLSELWIISAEGQTAANVADDAGSVDWSPTGTVLAYTNDGFVYTFNPETGERRALAHAGGFAWSPDGLMIAFDWSEAAGRDQVRQGLSVIAADGSGARQDVYQVKHKFSDGPMPHLQGWSGDGRYLSFWQAPNLSSSITADGAPLFVIPIEGSEPKGVGRTLLYQMGSSLGRFMARRSPLSTAAGATSG